ncbi:hypothetical protein [Brevundimonas sp.]|jgi:hypothetical protein|uniref:hypothetical protein n=1 Tax=Brevundimonas sp. TaxID=1871086 RepID=UPI0037BFE065
MKGWRILLSRLADGARRPSAVNDTPDVDPFDRPETAESAPPEALASALDEIEAGALEVYAAAGLPTQPGHYRKDPNAADWTFIGASVSPEDRFALVLAHTSDAGWRFARLQDLGARSGRPDLVAASRLLNEIADLRVARRGVLTDDHLLAAMELGGAWRALRDSRARRASRLTLTVPDADPPASAAAPKKRRARRDKSVKPR